MNTMQVSEENFHNLRKRVAKLEKLLKNSQTTHIQTFTDDLLNAKSFMAKGDLGRTKLHHLIKEGTIKPIKKGGRLYFHKAELEKLFSHA